MELKLSPQQILRNSRLAYCRAEAEKKDAFLSKKTHEYYDKLFKSTDKNEIAALHEERKTYWPALEKIERQKAEIKLRAQATADKFVPNN